MKSSPCKALLVEKKYKEFGEGKNLIQQPPSFLRSHDQYVPPEPIGPQALKYPELEARPPPFSSANIQLHQPKRVSKLKMCFMGGK